MRAEWLYVSCKYPGLLRAGERIAGECGDKPLPLPIVAPFLLSYTPLCECGGAAVLPFSRMVLPGGGVKPDDGLIETLVLPEGGAQLTLKPIVIEGFSQTPFETERLKFASGGKKYFALCDNALSCRFHIYAEGGRTPVFAYPLPQATFADMPRLLFDGRCILVSGKGEKPFAALFSVKEGAFSCVLQTVCERVEVGEGELSIYLSESSIPGFYTKLTYTPALFRCSVYEGEERAPAFLAALSRLSSSAMDFLTPALASAFTLQQISGFMGTFSYADFSACTPGAYYLIERTGAHTKKARAYLFDMKGGQIDNIREL